MDLKIKGRQAIVCGASKGLGKGCALALAREGVELVIAARDAAVLERAAADIRQATGATVRPVACDVATAEGRAALLRAMPEPDILVNNAGGPPPGDFREWSRDKWLAALDANMLAPIDLIRQTVDGMIARRFGRIVNITSSAVKSPISFLGLSNGARLGLTGFVAGLSRQIVQHNVTINSLLPGYHATARMIEGTQALASRSGRSVEDETGALLANVPAGRFGDPDEFGDACAFLCSARAGFITGQNLLVDGGAYSGTLG